MGQAPQIRPNGLPVGWISRVDRSFAAALGALLSPTLKENVFDYRMQPPTFKKSQLYKWQQLLEVNLRSISVAPSCGLSPQLIDACSTSQNQLKKITTYVGWGGEALFLLCGCKALVP